MTRISEAQTRKRFIDQRLKAAGWPITSATNPKSQDPAALREYPTANGPADYALLLDSQIVAVIEAKKLTLGPQNVLTQAQRYTNGLPQTAPFLYSTNGEVIWHHDIRHKLNRSRQIAQFHSPAALRELLQRDLSASIRDFAATPQQSSRIRPYQADASTAIEAAIAARHRHMLVAMATGTGKTFTIVNEIYRLMKAGIARRILFLVDRRALAVQAVRAFASFEAEPGLKFDQIYEVFSQRIQSDDPDEPFNPKLLPPEYLKAPALGTSFVYVSTIQRMTINLFGGEVAFADTDEPTDEDAQQIENIPIHAFDLIIADECHRGYTSNEVAIWRRTLDHFDAIKIGLTATPAAHTTSYFREVVYRYEYQRAVREGFLVDYDVITLRSNVRMNGIFLNEGEEIAIVDPETGARTMDALEDARQFDAPAVERDITAPASNRRILEELKLHCLEHQQRYNRFPKTLIFAANDLPHFSNADRLVDMARDVFGQGDSFVAKITGSPTVDRPLQRIREFRNRPEPSIVVTVDMLSTGVDIPDLEFIVFLRPVKSRILFEQMLGRGTRKSERYPDKSHFVVVDCFDGTLLDYFRNVTGITADPPTPSTRTISEIVEDIWQNRDRPYNIRCLVKRLQRVDKEMSGDARAAFAAFIPDGNVGAFARELPQRIASSFTATLNLLRNPALQNLLVNYERRRKVFIEAHTVQDEVTSEWRVRGADGQEYRPGDYLAAFSEFIRTQQNQIRAIGILLERPQHWNPNALQELRDTLAAAPQRFTVANLQRAHELTYHKALADIISMVKHAADHASPLLDSSERVERAFAQLTNGRPFTPDQLLWLDRIKTHLRENLSIDREDFESQPVFTHHGGWAKAAKVFGGSLSALLKEVNRIIAA